MGLARKSAAATALITIASLFFWLIFDARTLSLTQTRATFEAAGRNVKREGGAAYGVEGLALASSAKRDSLSLLAESSDASTTKPGLVVKGVVRFEDGSPAAGIAVRVAESCEQVFQSVSDEGGHYKLTVPGATLDKWVSGGWRLNVRAISPGNISEPILIDGSDLQLREVKLDLSLSAGGTISGLVVDQQNRIVCGADIALRLGGYSGEDIHGGPVLFQGVTDFNGEFIVPNIASELLVQVYSEMSGGAEFEVESTSVGEIVDCGVIHLSGSGVLRGNVRLPSGIPLSGAFLEIRSLNPNRKHISRGMREAFGVADSAGFFEFHGLQEGEYAVSTTEGGSINPSVVQTSEEYLDLTVELYLIELVLDHSSLGCDLNGSFIEWTFTPSEPDHGSPTKGTLFLNDHQASYYLRFDFPGTVVVHVRGDSELNSTFSLEHQAFYQKHWLIPQQRDGQRGDK